ncbi:hypothetical protein [Paracidobacterium acidisoli]|uniref:Uncharacterized protein n=1 Tax=Paracidobacterium acidisoli TaxID=2303751 RepID=A0A372IUK0_9BACT|nr:hypothetical protein [Paracidobacterium acidisoli]MBT9329919.1 hypothetical protein [Paracidobacterium acidisoli]
MFGLPPRILSTAAVALGLPIASGWIMLHSKGVDCTRLAPLTILATLAAFLISICFRQMNKFKASRQRWFLFACILVAGATLFADFRFVRRYRDLCDQMQQQIRQQMNTPNQH